MASLASHQHAEESLGETRHNGANRSELGLELEVQLGKLRTVDKGGSVDNPIVSGRVRPIGLA